VRSFALFQTQILGTETGVNPLLKSFPEADFEALGLLFEGDL
jgi:hypothetical protein